MADVIAEELADSGRLTEEQYTLEHRLYEGDMGGDLLSDPIPGLIDQRRRVPEEHPSWGKIEEAMSGVQALAATPEPSPGSVRARKTWARSDHVVRVDGGTWTRLAPVARRSIAAVRSIGWSRSCSGGLWSRDW